MFEEELKLEKRSPFVPLVLILTLLVIIVGIVAYVVREATSHVTPDQASALLAPSIAASEPPVLKFHTGTVKTVTDEYPSDARYKFLAKAGLVKIGKGKNVEVAPISLTPQGEQLLAQVPGVKKTTEKNGNVLYEVPLASRKLVGVSQVSMAGPSVAHVQFSWKWEPTAMGDLFDADNPTFKAFNSWERAMLIDKFGVKFYHGEPVAANAMLIKGDSGWRIAE